MKMFTYVESCCFLSHCSVFVSLLHEICFLVMMMIVVMIKMVFLFNSKGYCRETFLLRICYTEFIISNNLSPGFQHQTSNTVSSLALCVCVCVYFFYFFILFFLSTKKGSTEQEHLDQIQHQKSLNILRKRLLLIVNSVYKLLWHLLVIFPTAMLNVY